MSHPIAGQDTLIAMDSRERFSAVAGDYGRWRPGYPVEILDWIAGVTGIGAGARAVDLGCGTGIFSRLLAARGYRVVGIDPNQAMLAQARAAGGGVDYRVGEATSTGLDAGSCELVTAAQAFHWFALEPTLAELARILVPGGWTAAVWNLRAASAFNDEYERLLCEMSPEYPALSDLKDPRGALSLPGAQGIDLPHEDRLGWEGVIGRARSASYVAHGVGDPAGFERGLREIFDRLAAPDGTIGWTMRTIGLAWPR